MVAVVFAFMAMMLIRGYAIPCSFAPLFCTEPSTGSGKNTCNIGSKKSLCFNRKMISRNPTRPVRVGTVTIGGGQPIVVQSMCATKTVDVALLSGKSSSSPRPGRA